MTIVSGSLPGWLWIEYVCVFPGIYVHCWLCVDQFGRGCCSIWYGPYGRSHSRGVVCLEWKSLHYKHIYRWWKCWIFEIVYYLWFKENVLECDQIVIVFRILGKDAPFRNRFVNNKYIERTIPGQYVHIFVNRWRACS